MSGHAQDLRAAHGIPRLVYGVPDRPSLMEWHAAHAGSARRALLRARLLRALAVVGCFAAGLAVGVVL